MSCNDVIEQCCLLISDVIVAVVERKRATIFCIKGFNQRRFNPQLDMGNVDFFK